MNMLKHISKRHTLVILLGMFVGIAVIGQPIVNEYVKQQERCELKKEKENSDEKSEDSTPEGEKISGIEAVAPATQIQVTDVDYDLMDTKVSFQVFVKKLNHDFVESLSEKLLRVLFNFIISPNAP